MGRAIAKAILSFRPWTAGKPSVEVFEAAQPRVDRDPSQINVTTS
jgi:hypothetical protein